LSTSCFSIRWNDCPATLTACSAAYLTSSSYLLRARSAFATAIAPRQKMTASDSFSLIDRFRIPPPACGVASARDPTFSSSYSRSPSTAAAAASSLDSFSGSSGVVASMHPSANPALSAMAPRALDASIFLRAIAALIFWTIW